MTPDFYMQLALDEAWKYQGLTYPNPAVGAVVVGEKFEILSINAHQRAGEAHAEVLALRDAYVHLTKDETIFTCKTSCDIHTFLIHNHNNIFTNCSIFTTLEPCSHVGKTPSCASLIGALKLKKVYIGHKDENNEASDGATLLDSLHVKSEFGILETKSKELLEPFLIWQKRGFVTYKWAQRLDGTIDGGTVSSQTSREFVHKMRNVSDLMVVGGNTVRLDRPTLDARLVNGKAPDILIFSREKEFDKTIPLFNVEGRKVYISDNLDLLKEYKNILVEGGSGLFESLSSHVDRYLSFVSASSGGDVTFSNEKHSFEYLYVSKSEDMKVWIKDKFN